MPPSTATSKNAGPEDSSTITSQAQAASPSENRVDNSNNLASPKHSVPARGAVPVIPVLPKHSTKSQPIDKAPEQVKAETINVDDAGKTIAVAEGSTTSASVTDSPTSTPSAPVRAPPTSWANLFAKPASAMAPGHGPNGSVGGATVNGSGIHAGDASGSGFFKANASSLAEAIQGYRVESNDKFSFLEPRGLINTGNMCYMNSVSCFLKLMRRRI